MIEIKPCPFCGSTARLAEKSKTYFKGELTYNTYVYCPNCDARGRRAILSHFPTNRKARECVIEAWNRRVKLETGWISVNDRLPEKESPDYSVDVIVTNGKKTSIGYYNYRTGKWTEYYDEFPFRDISHWMQIPELPEVNKNDEP